MESRLALTLLGDAPDRPASETELAFDRFGGTIGRAEECSLVLPSENDDVSRYHARIECRDGDFYIVDTSTQGVYLNSAESPLGHGQAASLGEGDQIGIGPYRLKASLHADANVDADEIEHRPLPFRHQAELGHPQDEFSPPNALIPEHWDDTAAEPNGSRGEVGPDSVVDFGSNHYRVAIEALLEGLQLGEEISTEDLDPGSLNLVGQCLRLCMNNIAHWRTVQRRLHRRASKGEASETARGESYALRDIGDPTTFMSRILTACAAGDGQTADQLVARLACSLDLQHTEIVAYLVHMADTAMDGFSPITLDAAYRQALAAESAPTRLTRKLAPQSNRWKYYCGEFDGLRAQSTASSRRMLEAIFLRRSSRPRQTGNKARANANTRNTPPAEQSEDAKS